MKSGLEGRNNPTRNTARGVGCTVVSMKSGLEGRNNLPCTKSACKQRASLNEVRPRRPEQSEPSSRISGGVMVSMKSGLEGRNNITWPAIRTSWHSSLNEVRPRRPEQCEFDNFLRVRPHGLNEVRPRRPEQWINGDSSHEAGRVVSMKSGLEGRNNEVANEGASGEVGVSMKSGLEGRNNPYYPFKR